MRSTYSVGVRLGRGALGLIGLKAAEGLHHAGILARLIVGAHNGGVVPGDTVRSLGLVNRGLKRLAFIEPSGQATDWTDAVFDVWAQHQVPPCEVYHGWGNMCLRQLRVAHRRGTRTIVERASSHTLTQARLLAEEADRWGLRQPLTVASAIQRALAENEETDFVEVPSQFVYESFLSHGIPPSKIILNPFGVDTERFAPSVAKQTRPFRALFVGQVGLRKGVLDMLEAWRRAAIPGGELHIAGQISPEMPPLLARYRGLTGVTFMGHIDPVRAYQAADVFVFPSIEEGSALVTYEAMASGLPVVVTPNCGSIARDGEDGYVVPIREPDRVAECLVMLTEDPDRRHAMGATARRHVEQYTWSRYGERLADAHRRIARGEAPNGLQWLFRESGV